MYFDAPVNLLDDANHFMNLENAEVLRLRKLMHESILKVEKENLETIKKDSCNQKETTVKVIPSNNNIKKIPRHNCGPSSTTLKPSSLRSVKQKQPNVPDAQTSSEIKSANINSSNLCKNVQPKCQYSSIHFLNHFQSSFLSSKTRNVQPYDLKEKYTACAVPLAPPTQKKEIIDFEQDLASHKRSTYVSNNVAYHDVSEDINKKLTIQALPSISIMGRKPVNNENVKIEEIIELQKTYSTGDCIKTTILPALSEEVRNRISSINLSSSQLNKTPTSENRGNQPPILHPVKSVFTQSSQNSESLQVKPDKDILKEIVKEVLQELQSELPLEFLSHQNEQKIPPPENDCELDSFIGNTDSLSKDVTTMVSPNIFMKSSCTQTNYDLPHTAPSQIDMKNLVHDIVLEIQNTSKLCQSAEIRNDALKPEKEHKEIQVDLIQDETHENVISHVPKAVQVSLITKYPFETTSSTEANKMCDVIDAITQDNIEVISEPDIKTTSGIPERDGETNDRPGVAQAPEMPAKLESVLNFIYNRFCRETGELSHSTERIPSNNSPHSSRTREVAIQFNPISTSSKSTATSEVANVYASSQCDDLLLQQIKEKDIRHASVQVIPELGMVLPVPEKEDSSVQWEQPISALKDSCVQTGETSTPSENSTNTSVSSTPVSDSIFLDDMLSEGEVFLPWNLRLLSHADKNATQSSNNAEATDKEKDYSLSEGEIPPKYLQQFNLTQSSSYDSSSEADLPKYPEKVSTTTQKRRSDISPEAESLPVISHENRCNCRASSSSLSEGEVKTFSDSLSEGEVPYGYLKQRLSFQHALATQGSESVSSISQYESGAVHGWNLGENSPFQGNSRCPSLDLSEGEVITSPQMPYQSTPFTSLLDTVNEEK